MTKTELEQRELFCALIVKVIDETILFSRVTKGEVREREGERGKSLGFS